MRVERLNQMEAYILSKGTVTLYALSEHFDISLNTVRRDVADLIDRGHIRKVYGGVSVRHNPDSKPYSVLLPIAKRAEMHPREKQIIGTIAASLVEDDSVVFLDSGSTVPYMLPSLAEKNATIVTHSLSVMLEATKYPNLRVLALGGKLNHATNSLVGDALFGLRSIRLHALFMAATALSVEWGMLADSSKFGKNATYCYCPFTRIKGIVTDQLPNPAFLKAMRDNNIKLYYPGTPESEALEK